MHEPQFTVPPQLSAMEPQVWFAGQLVSGVHPQTFVLPPPPQVSWPVHVPQEIVPPQLLGAVPQS
jgi:hypothetical protein